MQREYMGYVGEACKNGMTAEEVLYLFNDIYNKSNTRKGRRVLKLFAQGIGGAKKKMIMNKQTSIQPQLEIPKMQKTFININQQ